MRASGIGGRLAAGLLLLALLAAPQALAAGPVQATLDAVLTVPTSDLEVNRSLETGLAQGVSSVCGSDLFTAGEDGFTFEDSPTQTQCGQIGYRFTPWFDAATMTLRFDADRTIVQPQDVQFPVLAPQQVRVKDADEVTFLRQDVFDATDGTKASVPFQVTLPPPARNQTLNLTWYFEDQGYSFGLDAPSVGYQQAYTATVTAPRILVTGVPLATTGTPTSNTTSDGERRTIETWTGFDVPAGFLGANDTAQATLRIDADVRFVGVRAPDGSLVAGLEPDDGLVVLPAAVLAAHGPGTYGVGIQSFEALPLDDRTPPAPATIYPVVFAIMASPNLPGLVAGYGAYGLARQTTGRVRRTTHVLAAFIVLAFVLYALLLAYVFVARRLALMATLPIHLEGGFLLVQFLVLFGVFMALWFVPNRTLRRAAEEELAEQQRLARDLERSNKDLENFAYIASHDLQEPLRSISGFTQLLGKRYGELLDERGRRYILRTVQGTTRMQHLIDDLLRYSRVQSHGGRLEATDLDATLKTVLEDLAATLHENHVRVHTGPLPTVACDANQVAQVFSNLVRNAIRYAHPDRSPVLAITCEDRPDEVEVLVRDNGIGIAAEHQERIFVIFQRLAARDADDDGGTGLGLAICQRIVERHGGRIWVDSTPGEGSTFHFTLPKNHGDPK